VKYKGQSKGLVYFALNEKGEKVTNPLNLFGKQAGMDSLQNHFEQSKEKMENRTSKES
jgi:hypothetical protein